MLSRGLRTARSAQQSLSEIRVGIEKPSEYHVYARQRCASSPITGVSYSTTSRSFLANAIRKYSSTSPAIVEPSPTSEPGTSPTERTDAVLTLADGRTLSYALYGPSDGRPVIFLHGTPSCRLEPQGIASSGLLDQVGVKMIVPERPGFGLSSPDRARTILGYTDDIEALTSHLGLEGGGKGRYAIVGGSGGGPYATACAYQASRSPDRFRNMHKVGLFAAAPPYISPIPTHSSATDDDTKHLQRDWMIKSKLVFGLATRFPTLSRAITAASLRYTARLWGTQWGRRKLEEYVAAFLSSAASDSAAYQPQSRDELEREVAAFIALTKETWRQGPDGWLDEVRLLGASWGFDPAHIRCAPHDERPEGLPLKIWHGDKDVNAPLAPMRWLADRIDGSELVVVAEKGHFGLGDTLEEMLEWAAFEAP